MKISKDIWGALLLSLIIVTLIYFVSLPLMKRDYKYLKHEWDKSDNGNRSEKHEDSSTTGRYKRK